MEITRAILVEAFERMGALEAARGAVIDMAVYGGSCLVLVSDIRNASGDVDAVFLAEPALAYALSDTVGRELGLPPGWLNQAVKLFAPPKGNPSPALLPAGEYPMSGVVGLRVFVPTPHYLLAMKLIANRRDDAAGSQRDSDDIAALMRLTGLETYEGLRDLIVECFPRLPGVTEPSLSARLEAKLKDAVDALASRADSAVSPPAGPWLAGAGRPVR